MGAVNMMILEKEEKLRNLLNQILVLYPEVKVILLTDAMQLPSAADGMESFSAFDLASVERVHIQRVLQYTKGNKVEAARLLNIGLTTVYRKIEEYGLS